MKLNLLPKPQKIELTGGTRALTGQPGDVRLRELRVEHHHVVHLSFEIIAVLADAEIERLVQ